MGETRPWWHEPLRVIQYNLQVKDTPGMDPEKMARDAQEMHANELVINVGGIYAWYKTEIPFHHVNEYLTDACDILDELITASHKRGIRLIARFDFSKTHDYVSQIHPEWFIRNPDGTRCAYGTERPGNWSILYSTCINAGYRNDEVAVPVLREAVSKYGFDGVFFNAPNYEYCTCEACKAKYRSLYGKELPVKDSGDQGEATYGYKKNPPDLEPGFPGICYRDNIMKLNAAIKETNANIPLILYYGIEQENLEDRLQTYDMLCIEAQDILSRGQKDIPPVWLPQIIMKLGRSIPSYRHKPFGIIHSCPGMDWRHTGLPVAEYEPWLRQIPAAGGMIWHSITGYNDTVSDKRILKAVKSVNRDISIIEADMDGASEYYDVGLVWGAKDSEHWANLLVGTHTQFRLLHDSEISEEELQNIPVLVLPERQSITEETRDRLRRFAEAGGTVIVEGSCPEFLRGFSDLLGIDEHIYESEYLTACYWQFENTAGALRNGFENTPVLPHRGKTAYTKPTGETWVPATLIPPFAPLNSVGAPPERASMLVPHTSIPLCTVRQIGNGIAVMIPFHLAELSATYGLESFYRIWNNLLNLVLGSRRRFNMEMMPGVVVNAYQKPGMLLVHLVNEMGQRPLMRRLTCIDVSFDVLIPEGKRVAAVKGVLSDAEYTWTQQGDRVQIDVHKLSLWEMWRISFSE